MTGKLPTYLLIHIPNYLLIPIRIHTHTYLPFYLLRHLPTYSSTYLHTYLPTHIHAYISTYLYIVHSDSLLEFIARLKREAGLSEDFGYTDLELSEGAKGERGRLEGVVRVSEERSRRADR